MASEGVTSANPDLDAVRALQAYPSIRRVPSLAPEAAPWADCREGFPCDTREDTVTVNVSADTLSGCDTLAGKCDTLRVNRAFTCVTRCEKVSRDA